MLDPNDPEVHRWHQIEQIFPSSDEMLIIGITDSSDLLRPSLLNRQWLLHSALSSIEGVKKVGGLTTVPFLVFHGDSAWAEPFYRHAGTDSASFDILRFLAYPDVRFKFLSADQKAACLYIFYASDLPMETKGHILNEARHHVEHYFPMDPVVYSPTVLQLEQVQAMQREAWQLGLYSAILCLVLIWSAFRSVRATFFPLIIIALTVLWALGLMALCGFPVTPASLAIPGVLAVVSLSDIIHILSAVQESPQHLPISERVQAALNETRRPVTITALTTFLGFFLLIFTGVPSVQHFGLIASTGVIFSWMFSLFLAPNLLVIKGVLPPKRNIPASGWINIMVRMVAASNKPVRVASIFVLALVLSVWEAKTVKLDAPLYEDVGRSDELGKMVAFFETHFSGIRNICWIVEAADSTKRITDPECMRQLDRLGWLISEVCQTEDVYSPSTEVKRIWRAWQGGTPNAFQLPENPIMLKKIRKEMMVYYDTLGLASSLTRNQRTALVTGRMHDKGSAAASQVYAMLDSAISAGMFPDIQITPTGTAYLLDRSAVNMFEQLKYGLLVEVLMVCGIWWIQTRSLRMSLIALIPNMLPMIMLMGIMGLLYIPLKFSTMSVFTIIFGISVDDTIHYLHRYKMELAKPGISARSAARRATIVCGKPMVLTTLTLVAGFGIMTLSSFHGTFLSGALTASCLFLAMITDLWLHPALQIMLARRDAKDVG